MLQDCQEAQSKQEQYRASMTRKPRALMQDFSEEAHLCYQAKRMGLPISETTIIVNEWRMNNKKDLLSWSAVQSFISGSNIMVLKKRGVKMERKVGQAFGLGEGKGGAVCAVAPPAAPRQSPPAKSRGGGGGSSSNSSSIISGGGAGWRSGGGGAGWWSGGGGDDDDGVG